MICRPTYRAQRRRWRCSQLVAKGSDRTTPTLTRRSFQHLLEERLTRRQHDALARAHEAGYYEWPRRTTADELADSLEVSAPTFHKHLRGAEDKFVGALFETPSVGSARKRINTD